MSDSDAPGAYAPYGSTPTTIESMKGTQWALITDVNMKLPSGDVVCLPAYTYGSATGTFYYDPATSEPMWEIEFSTQDMSFIETGVETLKDFFAAPILAESNEEEYENDDYEEDFEGLDDEEEEAPEDNVVLDTLMPMEVEQDAGTGRDQDT